ncbi:MAG: deoxyribonuclease IV [Chloroflexota bacterium]
MLIGAHVSAAGGLQKTVERACGIGAEAMQIFASSPRAWAFTPPDDEAVAAFKRASRTRMLGPTLLHGIYLLALGSPDRTLYERSVESLAAHLQTACRLDALGVVFHPGSHRGAGLSAVLRQFAGGMRRILEEAPGDAPLILENSAGAGDSIGSSFRDLAVIIEEVGSDRVGVCLDTQHAWAAGYDLSTAQGVDRMLKDVDGSVGLERLAAVHANDSARPLGSGIDRHENIGEGHMGVRSFACLMAAPELAGVPFYLEVPGFKGKGPDRQNVRRLKQLRSRFPVSRELNRQGSERATTP